MAGGSVLVFSRVPDLFEWLDENRVTTEEEREKNVKEAA